MTFHILTIFPNLVKFYFYDSILKKAIERKLINIKIWDIRQFSTNKHKAVDDKPYGGGPGMLLQISPIFYCLEHIFKKGFHHKLAQLKDDGKLIILTSATGKVLNQKKVVYLSNFKEIAIICGRYEGVDERVRKYLIHEEISLGKFILAGGEIASLAIVEAVTRLVPGVLGNVKSLQEESFTFNTKIEYPQYTRPSIFKPDKKTKWSVPEVLLSGNHLKITKWRKQNQKMN